MNTQVKGAIKSGIISGVIYAGLMALIPYSDGQGFRIWRFIFSALFFGTLMGLLTLYHLKKQERKNN